MYVCMCLSLYTCMHTHSLSLSLPPPISTSLYICTRIQTRLQQAYVLKTDGLVTRMFVGLMSGQILAPVTSRVLVNLMVASCRALHIVFTSARPLFCVFGLERVLCLPPFRAGGQPFRGQIRAQGWTLWILKQQCRFCWATSVGQARRCWQVFRSWSSTAQAALSSSERANVCSRQRTTLKGHARAVRRK